MWAFRKQIDIDFLYCDKTNGSLNSRLLLLHLLALISNIHKGSQALFYLEFTIKEN